MHEISLIKLLTLKPYLSSSIKTRKRNKAKSEQDQERKRLDEGESEAEGKKTIHTKEPQLDPPPCLYKEEHATHEIYTI